LPNKILIFFIGIFRDNDTFYLLSLSYLFIKKFSGVDALISLHPIDRFWHSEKVAKLVIKHVETELPFLSVLIIC
jgi:hypothetical protein